MKHQTISFLKSGIRIAGYLTLLAGPAFLIEYWLVVWVGGWTALVLSEMIGVWEEIGHE